MRIRGGFQVRKGSLALAITHPDKIRNPILKKNKKSLDACNYLEMYSKTLFALRLCTLYIFVFYSDQPIPS